MINSDIYAFLFDLDGTLILTDDIYFEVWSEILQIYNISLTHEIFKKYIQGNNDQSVINSLLFNIKIDLNNLSNLKDELFIKNIDKIKIIDGIYNILDQIKSNNHKCCIVTNCNRIVAEKIIEKINITQSIDFIISSNDCKFGKPNKEPYMNAIQKYKKDDICNEHCIIFEDSKSGLLSAKSVNPRLLIGIESIYDANELKNYGVDLSIKNFENLNINNLFELSSKESKLNILKIIKNSLNLDKFDKNSKIIIDESKLKGGFIADIISLKIKDSIHLVPLSYVVKYENNESNNLTNMAKQLDLYNREYYFYKEISYYINVKIPKFISILKDDHYNDVGIILENLFDKNLKINLNLNIENIDISLKVVDNMAKMHSKFWNKDLKKMFPKLKKTNDSCFCPFFKEFILERYDDFKNKWKNVLNPYQLQKCDEIVNDFENIQTYLSHTNLTFIHGDIKSPNLFYDIQNNNDYKIYFLDWQHCGIGKGVQDLIFFIIESFDITNIKSIYELFKIYYYKKIIEYGVVNYSFDEYEKDIMYALYYIPFFTSMWFGTIPNDELIDKTFPYFFILKLFYLIEIVTENKTFALDNNL